jgi:hypothetical protein
VSARPTVAEERWLALAARLRGVLPRGALDDRTGGWKITGPLVRIALFAAGVFGALMVAGIVAVGAGSSGENALTGSMIVSGLLVAGGAEAMIRGTKAFQGGVAEGAYATGLVLFVLGLASRLFEHSDPAGVWLLGGLALIAAGLRVANSFVATVGLALVCGWLGTTAPGGAVDRLLGPGAAPVIAACAAATGALLAGGRTYSRPSTDRLLDAIVAGLPLLTLLFGLPFAARTFVDDGMPVPSSGSTVVALVLIAYAALAATLGLRRRRHAPLYGAMLAAGIALVVVRRTLGGPDEAWLVVPGLAMLVTAVALERRLRDRTDGVTSAKLSEREGLGDLVQLAGVATLRAPGGHAGGAEPPPGVEGGGGRYGGGGASGSF